MKREGKLDGKPTNKTKQRGKCAVVHCSMCHFNSPLKSLKKCKGQRKFSKIMTHDVVCLEKAEFFDWRWDGRKHAKHH